VALLKVVVDGGRRGDDDGSSSINALCLEWNGRGASSLFGCHHAKAVVRG